MVRIGDALRLSRNSVEVDPMAMYANIGVRSFGKGVFHYPECAGADLSKLRFYTFPIPSLVVSNIKAWEGAVAMTSEADEGCIASNRFLFYVPKHDNVCVRYIYHYLLSYPGRRALGAASPGSADRNRTLSIKSFENIEMDLPQFQDQVRLADELHARLELIERARHLIQEEEQLLDRMRSSLLDEAFPGSVTPLKALDEFRCRLVIATGVPS